VARRKKINPNSGPLTIGNTWWKNESYGYGNTYSFSNTKDVHYDKLARVKREDGTVVDLPMWTNYTNDFEDLKKQHTVEVIGDATSGLKQVVIVPDEYHQFENSVTFQKKTPLMCLYDAIADYCQSILGVKFTEEDRTFFKNHPATQEDGVPFPDTLRVAQELIAPYGLRVSRVQVQKNYGVKGDILQWRGVLNCNPLALGDRMTSNAEFYEKFKLDPTKVPPMLFEYANEALFPSISCGVIYNGQSTGVTGSTGGHAVYLPPRRRASGALLSFQIDRAEKVVWKKEPVFPASEGGAEATPKSCAVFDLDAWWKSDFREKKTVVSHIFPVRKETKPQEEAKGAPPSSVKKPPCFRCNRRDADRTHNHGYAGICDQCWDTFIHSVDCTTQTCRGNTQTYPHLRLTAFHKTSRSIYMECPVCRKQYRLQWEPKAEKPLKEMIKAIEAYMQDNKLHHYRVREEEASKPHDTIPASD
jgi:hypothetical protein